MVFTRQYFLRGFESRKAALQKELVNGNTPLNTGISLLSLFLERRTRLFKENFIIRLHQIGLSVLFSRCITSFLCFKSSLNSYLKTSCSCFQCVYQNQKHFICPDGKFRLIYILCLLYFFHSCHIFMSTSLFL